MELKTFTKTFRGKLGETGVYPSEKVLARFDDLVKDKKFHQVLFTFGKNYLEVALTYYENIEEYLVCAEIIQQVEKYNRTRGDNVKLVSWNQKS